MLRLRQICLVAADKDQVVQEFATLLKSPVLHGSGDLSRYGLPARGPMFEGGHRVLDALGVENLIFSAGADFIEVIFPNRPDSSALKLMQRRGGPTGYMIILQADDVGFYGENAEKLGIRIVHQAQFPKYQDLHFHPKDTGAALLSVARQMPENVIDGPWYPAGSVWERARGTTHASNLIAAELQSPEPEALAIRWGQLLGRTIEQKERHFEIALDNGVLRIGGADQGRQEAFSGFALRVKDPDAIRAAARKCGAVCDEWAIRLCGMRVSLVQE